MNKKGFSLAEFMIAMVIAAIIILMVGAIAQVSTGSVIKLRGEASVDDDACFALGMIQHAVRHSTSVPTTGANTLVADNKTFQWVANGAVKDLVYVEGGTTQKLIFGVDPSSSFTSSLSGKVVTVSLTLYKKIKASDSQLTKFEYLNVKAMRRNP